MFPHPVHGRRAHAKALSVVRRPFRPLLDFLEDRLAPARILWTGGAAGNFGDAANWTVENSDPPVRVVPGTADDAVVTAPGVRITANGNYTVRSLSFPAGGGTNGFHLAGGSLGITNACVLGELTVAAGATMIVHGGTMNLIYGATLAGQLTANAGAVVRFGMRTDLNQGAQLTGPGQFTAAGGVNSVVNVNAPVSVLNFSLVNGSRLSGSSPFTVANRFDWTDGTMDGPGVTEIAAGATLNLSGSNRHVLDRTLNNRGTVNMTRSLFGTGSVSNDGTWDIQADLPLSGNTFTNKGTLLKSAGTRAAVLNTTLDNQGTARARQGTLQFVKGSTSTGSFDTTGGVLDFASGLHVFNPGTSLTGNGFLVIGSASSNPVLQVNVNLAVTNLILEGNGSLTGTGTVTVTSYLDWSGGTMSGTGITRLATEAVWVLNTPGVRALSRTFDLAGYALWYEGDFTLSNNAALNVLPTGYFDVQHFTDHTVDGTGALNIAGVLFKGGPARTVLGLDVRFNNNGGFVGLFDGTVDAAQAYVQTDGYTQMIVGTTLRAVGGVDLRAGYLVGTGTLVGNVSNGGWIEVGGFTEIGTLRIQGTYRQLAGAVLSLELGGTVPGLDQDQLDITGTARLDGYLLVSLLPNYLPGPGDVFDMLKWSGVEGALVWSQLPQGLSMEYRADGLRLTTTA